MGDDSPVTGELQLQFMAALWRLGTGTRLSEADYLSRLIARTLAGASSDARQAALARLIGELGEDELSALQRLAREMKEMRQRR